MHKNVHFLYFLANRFRYNGRTSPVTAVIAGGIATQEAIKVITEHFIPVLGKFILFNGTNVEIFKE